MRFSWILEGGLVVKRSAPQILRSLCHPSFVAFLRSLPQSRSFNNERISSKAVGQILSYPPKYFLALGTRGGLRAC